MKWHRRRDRRQTPMSYMAERLFADVTKNRDAVRALGPHRPEEALSSLEVMAEAFELALRARHGPLPRQEDIEQTVDAIMRRTNGSVSSEEVEALVRFHLGQGTDGPAIDQLLRFNIWLVGFLMLAWASPRWSEEDTRVLLQEADRRVRARGVSLPPARF